MNNGSFSGKVIRISEAIARAEGFYVDGSVPQRKNNPGDIERRGVIIDFLDVDMGWWALRMMIRGWLEGTSGIYRPDTVIWDVAFKYVDGKNDPKGAIAWAHNVASELGVTTQTALKDIPD